MFEVLRIRTSSFKPKFEKLWPVQPVKENGVQIEIGPEKNLPIYQDFSSDD